tara:strand:+ start:1448 stop:1621 length:174 start_codon:yes stop_codon:yes gene_type:complete
MEEYNTIFVGLDVSKDRHAVAVAESGRDGIVRYFGEIGSDDASVRPANAYEDRSLAT